MIQRHFKIAILIVLILTLTFGLVIVNVNTTEQQDEEKYNTIGTGSMPADTMEERAEMRKMTAMANYNTEDPDT